MTRVTKPQPLYFNEAKEHKNNSPPPTICLHLVTVVLTF